MALPIIPIVLATGLTGVTGFFTGSAFSDKLGTALKYLAVVVGLFLVLR